MRWLLAFWYLAMFIPWACADGVLPGVCAGGWLGVVLAPQTGDSGAQVIDVESPGPAIEAGLQAGDTIIGIAGFVIRRPEDAIAWASDSQPGDAAEITLLRDGTRLTRIVHVWGVPKAACLARLGEHALPQGKAGEAGSAPGVRADGMKASVAVGGFDVKAAKATGAIGDGLREMLVSALHQSGYFVVVEREDLRGVPAEQDLSRSPLARGGSAVPASIDVADIMIFGAVTEFEPKAGGSSFMTPMRGVPLAMGARISWSQLALDVRVVDVRTGRVLGAERIPGLARFAQATIAGSLPLAGGVGIPAGLSVYRNTPMEWAIRDCLRKVGYFVINSIGDEYYRHR